MFRMKYSQINTAARVHLTLCHSAIQYTLTIYLEPLISSGINRCQQWGGVKERAQEKNTEKEK